MKCACGNEVGRPRVKPFPISYMPDDARKSKDGKKEVVHLMFMGGMDCQPDGTCVCWFCRFPRS